MAQGNTKNRGGGLRLFDGVVLFVVGVVGVILAFAVLSFVAGLVWEVVKIAVIVAVVAGVLWLLVGRRS